MADNELRISEVPTGLIVAGGGLDKRVMTKASNFVTSHAAGEWGMEATRRIEWCRSDVDRVEHLNERFVEYQQWPNHLPDKRLKAVEGCEFIHYFADENQ